MTVAWNPRYLAYAKAHGFEGDPEGMLAHDSAEWPGGHMTGFILWIQARWAEWRKLYAKELREERPGHYFDHQGTFDRMLGITLQC